MAVIDLVLVTGKNSLLLAGLTAVLAAACVYAWFAGQGRDVATFASPAANKVVVIDAGHGGIDSGASGFSGTAEKELNLAVALQLQEFIEQGGGVALMTRVEDNSTQNPDRPAGMSQKQSDILERKHLMDESRADIFVSIHMNHYEGAQYKGAQVFYADNGEKSKNLAKSIQLRLKNDVDPSNKREAKTIQNTILLLKNVNTPAVLVECGFLSNPEEARLLQTEAYQRKLAWAIYMGINQYFTH